MECDSGLVGQDYVSHASIPATNKSDLIFAFLLFTDHTYVAGYRLVGGTLGPSLAPQCSPGFFDYVGDEVLRLLPAFCTKVLRKPFNSRETYRSHGRSLHIRFDLLSTW